MKKKTLLIIAYYFPPVGMSGTQRVAKFAKYLPENGWQAVVLTVKPILYFSLDKSLLQDIGDTPVIRTESLDPQRILYRFGKRKKTAAAGRSAGLLNLNKVLSFFCLPDLKRLWHLHAMQVVRKLHKQYRFDAVFSTSPPHSVHLLARHISGKYQIPWIADFRDSWSGGVVVQEPTWFHRYMNKRLQRSVVKRADAVIGVTTGIIDQLLLDNEKKFYYIPNGFDPDDYPKANRRAKRQVVFCHCGSVTKFSHPGPLLEAIQLLLKRKPDLKTILLFQFVGYDALGNFRDMVRQFGLDQVVQVISYKSHRQALQYVVDADALVLIARGRKEDRFIPGKTYEYIGAQKNILAITDVAEIRQLLSAIPGATRVAYGDAEKIAETIEFILTKSKDLYLENNIDLSLYNRRHQTAELAAVLDSVIR
ncbi:glycosyltransferase [candidate division KSB1 bacterium]|nr:glycosyltransferase [candidate division KSB1 bacterium]